MRRSLSYQFTFILKWYEWNITERSNERAFLKCFSGDAQVGWPPVPPSCTAQLFKPIWTMPNVHERVIKITQNPYSLQECLPSEFGQICLWTSAAVELIRSFPFTRLSSHVQNMWHFTTMSGGHPKSTRTFGESCPTPGTSASAINQNAHKHFEQLFLNFQPSGGSYCFGPNTSDYNFVAKLANCGQPSFIYKILRVLWLTEVMFMNREHSLVLQPI